MTVVVDACIAKSAGTNVSALSSTESADVLNHLFRSSLSCHLCPTLDVEWATHASRLSRKWLIAMQRKGRIHRGTVLPCAELTAAIDGLSARDSKKAGLLKDRHLIDAAYCLDYRIIGRDGVAWRSFRRLAPKSPKLNRIYWAHCDTAGVADVLNWVSSGAPNDPNMLLTRP